MSISSDIRQLSELEERVLNLLQSSTGHVLDDEALIETLDSSQSTASALSGRVAEAQLTEVEIDKSRSAYRTVAARGSLIFFVVVDLARIDPMYQYSLTYFMQLYQHCVEVGHLLTAKCTRMNTCAGAWGLCHVLQLLGRAQSLIVRPSHRR